MATKLKNMRLTSVDLVRSGANQEADICLYKSADPSEATEQPTAGEMNILKRFLGWLRKNPTEGEYEPEDPVEKADDLPDPIEVYKTAITESILSIVEDSSLTPVERESMIAKSLSQYHDAMAELVKTDDMSHLFEGLEKSFEEGEEVEKFNPHHGSDGRFASGGGGAAAAGGGEARRAELKDVVSGHSDQGERAAALQELLGKDWYTTSGNTVEREADTGGEYMSEVKVTPKKGGYLDTEFVYSDGGSRRETYDSVEALSQAADKFLGKVAKSANFDYIEEVQKFNPYHGADGRFASANGYASFTYSPGKSKAHDNAIAREKQRQASAGGTATGGTGAGGTATGGGATAAKPVSPTSTKGKIVDQGFGLWYGENDNGYSAQILDCGKSNTNYYKYGSYQVYEVGYNSNTDVSVKPRSIATTKKDAMQMAKDWLKQTKDL